MRWRGQGVLTAVVLAVAGAYAFQWQSVNAMKDEIEGSGLPIAIYVRSVAEFVDKEKRFPRPGEVILPASPKGGIFRRVDLGSDGALDFTLSARTMLDGHMHLVMEPMVNWGALLPAQNRLHYSCVDVRPAKFASVVCRNFDFATREELKADNQKAFADWETDRRRVQAAAIATKAAKIPEQNATD